MVSYLRGFLFFPLDVLVFQMCSAVETWFLKQWGCLRVISLGRLLKGVHPPDWWEVHRVLWLWFQWGLVSIRLHRIHSEMDCIVLWLFPWCSRMDCFPLGSRLKSLEKESQTVHNSTWNENPTGDCVVAEDQVPLPCTRYCNLKVDANEKGENNVPRDVFGVLDEIKFSCRLSYGQPMILHLFRSPLSSSLSDRCIEAFRCSKLNAAAV